MPVPHPVDELDLVIIHMPNNLARQDPGFEPLGLLYPDIVEDRRPCRPCLGL